MKEEAVFKEALKRDENRYMDMEERRLELEREKMDE